MKTLNTYIIERLKLNKNTILSNDINKEELNEILNKVEEWFEDNFEEDKPYYKNYVSRNYWLKDLKALRNGLNIPMDVIYACCDDLNITFEECKYKNDIIDKFKYLADRYYEFIMN